MKKVIVIMILALSIPMMSLANNSGNDPLIKTKISFRNWIASNINYPSDAVNKSEEGIVYVSFTISENVQTENVKIVEGVSKALDKEAIEAVQNMPVSVLKSGDYKQGLTYILPIKFILK